MKSKVIRVLSDRVMSATHKECSKEGESMGVDVFLWGPW